MTSKFGPWIVSVYPGVLTVFSRSRSIKNNSISANPRMPYKTLFLTEI